MGEHKQRLHVMHMRDDPNKPNPQPAAMVVSDLEDVGRVLADEEVFCEQCGEMIELWPPEKMRDHTVKLHPETVWPAIAEAWKTYETDTDLARRENFVNAFRVDFFVAMLQHRRDIYEKLVEAGVIRAPAQG